MNALETMWMLKQFVIPVASRADLDSLAAAHVLLSSASRPERRRMLGLRVSTECWLYFGHFRFYRTDTVRVFKAPTRTMMTMSGLRYIA